LSFPIFSLLYHFEYFHIVRVYYIPYFLFCVKIMELYQKRSLSRALYDQKFSKIKLPHDPVTVENFPSAQKRMDPSLIHPFSSLIIFRKDSTFLKVHTDHTILFMSSSRSQNCNAHQNLPLSPKDRKRSRHPDHPPIY